MPILRIVYELSGVSYSGASVGHDWTFHIHTGGGLVRFESNVRRGSEDGRVRVLAVHEVEAPDDAPGFVHERWWVSAIERDAEFPDRGAGLSTPVAIALEAGAEVWRTLEFEVVEQTAVDEFRNAARLRCELRARVELASEQPAPVIDAQPLALDADVPRPSQTAGELPESFDVELEGVGAGTLAVVATRRVLLELGEAADEPVAQVLAGFLANRVGGFAPAWYEPRIALYELRNVDARPFWSDPNSSMGQRNHERVIAALAAAAPPLGSESTPFELQASLLLRLFEFESTAQLGAAAASIAALVATLIEQHPEQAQVERQWYLRSSTIDDFSGEWTHVFFVDPTPFGGPDIHLWMVVWTTTWTE